MSIEYCENVMNRILRNVPKYLRDDCRQAAYLGYLEACEKIKSHAEISNKSSYIYSSMHNRVLQELALLHGSGIGIFSMPATMFLKLSKYKTAVQTGDDVELLSLSKGTEKVFSHLSNAQRYSDSLPNGESRV